MHAQTHTHCMTHTHAHALHTHTHTCTCTHTASTHAHRLKYLYKHKIQINTYSIHTYVRTYAISHWQRTLSRHALSIFTHANTYVRIYICGVYISAQVHNTRIIMKLIRQTYNYVTMWTISRLDLKDATTYIDYNSCS